MIFWDTSCRGIKINERKIDDVICWPVPTKLREVRGFLGLCGYYRRFVLIGRSHFDGRMVRVVVALYKLV